MKLVQEVIGSSPLLASFSFSNIDGQKNEYTYTAGL